MGQNVVEKIVQQHLVSASPEGAVTAGDFVAVRPRHVMTHDNTAAVLKKFRAIGAARCHDPGQPVFTLDHDIQNRSQANLAKYREIEAFAAKQGIAFHPAGRGIGHQVMVEEGFVHPGSLVVASDSHSNMYGALGALGTPVVRTDAAAIWATGEFWWQVPEAVQVVLSGRLQPGVTGKDVIIALCGLYADGEVLNKVVEFSGPGVATLNLEERLTIANMTTEWGALAGWFPADQVTLDFLQARGRDAGEAAAARVPASLIQTWREQPLHPDAEAIYAARIDLDLEEVVPQVLGPDNVQTVNRLDDLQQDPIAIQKAYIVSCVNSRLGDLQAAAEVLAGKQVAQGVELYLAAASSLVQEKAEEQGIWQTLLAAGARPLPPGCGPCIGLGAGLLADGEVGISATNRNFKGRMGSRNARCYLASPAVVAASALAGRIVGPGSWPAPRLTRRFRPAPAKATAGGGATETGAPSVAILAGFPERLRGRLVFVPQDNLNTDLIYGKDYTYREDMTPEMMAGVVMENYDPHFAGLTGPGDILVGGFNFGTGSSREQAATSLQAKGFPTVIAGSYSQTYLRNAFNNGVPCISSPGLVAHLQHKVREEGKPVPKTLILPGEIEVDFTRGRIIWSGQSFSFPPLGRVPQELVVAGGVENQVRQRLGVG